MAEKENSGNSPFAKGRLHTSLWLVIPGVLLLLTGSLLLSYLLVSHREVWRNVEGVMTQVPWPWSTWVVISGINFVLAATLLLLWVAWGATAAFLADHRLPSLSTRKQSISSLSIMGLWIIPASLYGVSFWLSELLVQSQPLRSVLTSVYIGLTAFLPSAIFRHRLGRQASRWRRLGLCAMVLGWSGITLGVIIAFQLPQVRITLESPIQRVLDFLGLM